MIPYIINVALIVAGCLAFYKILLRRETFYKINRYVLMACLVIAFGLPLVHVPQQWSLRKKETVSVAKPSTPGNITRTEKEAVSQRILQPPLVEQPTPTSNRISFAQVMRWMVILYWFGVVVFGISFLVQVGVLYWKAYRNPVIIDGECRIVEVSGDKAPCSFGNNIFINPSKYEWDTYNQILLHEKVHIRQRHTLDILAAELVLIFQWFNPFAWIYRREVENNLEYLTDDQLMQHQEVERTSYQLSLVKVSAPHLPLSLTTNYNQSILKKRIAMMNAKKSNLHTAWKYFFLIPVLVLFACLLNEPKAISQTDPKVEARVDAKTDVNPNTNIETEGSWFATIKDDMVSMQFKQDEDNEHSFNNSTFKLSEFSALPRGTAGSFKLTRDAGTMEFTGKFEGNTGMGHYKFMPDQSYRSSISGEIKEKLEDRDVMVFFFVNMKKDYVPMLKGQGFTGLSKDQLIPLAALKVDAAFIKSVKDNGYKDVELENLVTLKALNISADYIQEIRSAGYKNVTLDQLVTFKAQGIDKEYITKMRNSKLKNGGNDDDDPNDIVTFKALNITDEFINSFREVGYTNLANEDYVSMKALGITPEFIKTYQAMGYKNIPVEDLTALKALNITPEFIKGFEAIGYKDVPLGEFSGLKSMGVTPAYVTSMKEKGFNYDKLSKYITLKSID